MGAVGGWFVIQNGVGSPPGRLPDEPKPHKYEKGTLGLCKVCRWTKDTRPHMPWYLRWLY